MNSRFTALRVIGSLFKVLAWIDLVLGLLIAALVLILGLTVRLPLGLLDLEGGGPLVGVAGFVAVLIIAVLLFLLLYAGGEFIYVLLSIEENSRRTAYFSQEQFRAMDEFSPAPVSHPTHRYDEEDGGYEGP